MGVSGSESIVSDNISDDSSVFFVENQFMGCYKREDLKTYRTQEWGTLIRYVDQVLKGGVDDFRLKLCMYAVELGFEINWVRNNKQTVVACCSKKLSDGCDWLVKASLCRHNNYFCITKLVNEHKCRGVVRLQKSSMMGSKIIKSLMLDKLRADPNKSVVDISKELKTDYGLDVSYHKAWYDKELARDAMMGNEAESYAQLNWFCQQTVTVNPEYEINVEIYSESKRFQRMFVSYSAWMKGFQACRPLLFIDATFITNKYQCQLLAATSKDGNSGTFSIFYFSSTVTGSVTGIVTDSVIGMYLVAYAIVDAESESNWRFFLEFLSLQLSKYSSCRYTDNAYLKHRISNLFMQCAYSRIVDTYEKNMEALLAEGGTLIEDVLEDLPKEIFVDGFGTGYVVIVRLNGVTGVVTTSVTGVVTSGVTGVVTVSVTGAVTGGVTESVTGSVAGALTFFRPIFFFSKYGEMTNNMVECFNNWVLPMNSLPIVEMNEVIRVKSMEYIETRKDEVKDWVSILCPKMEL
ncbi:uncharacterized protein LOC126804346 [Argentina anserina]|uniref:uncharacterized protein LOC126804346 n=1 Tax=Argentina anserina TaxID=57926 RepID=UPI0021765CD8|nr:uncharacterized protein LOC126804346 [Potentilla anserina]